MRLLRVSSAILVVLLLLGTAPPLRMHAAAAAPTFTVSGPVDAFSVTLQSESFRYRSRTAAGWSQWMTYEDDGDSAPGAESELIMLPRGVATLEVSGIASASDIHPITVASDPVRRDVASIGVAPMAPSIISRAAWGADESYLYASGAAAKNVVGGDSAKGDNGTVVTSTDQRLRDCQAAQAAYPDEFKPDRTVTKNPQGKTYLWPLQYSRSVKLLVVHHTALKTEGDTRTPVERVRALYKYHAINRGWADIGYNFIVDDRGNVYEGRMGGRGVVGGHAFCNNVGTIGIVVMGNFEVEKPTQAQAQTLQRLLASLASEHNIDLRKPARFHGKDFPSPIIGHRDLLSTLCPGYSLWNALPQIRSNILEGRLDAGVVFPTPPSAGAKSSSPSVSSPDTSQFAKVADGISFVGRTSIASNPGGKQRLSFAYTAGIDGAYEGKKIADVRLSSTAIKLWVDDGVDQIPVSKGILLPYDLPAGETLTFQLIVEAPMEPGMYAMDIAGIHFTLSAEGRRARSGTFTSPFYAKVSQIVRPQETKRSTAIIAKVRPQSRLSRKSTAPSPTQPTQPTSPTSSPSSLRIRLSIDPGVALAFQSSGEVSDMPVRAGTEFSLLLKNGECEANHQGIRFTSGPVLRFRTNDASVLLLKGVKGFNRTYRGTLECRVVDGALTVINELPLEDYMRGVSEEPDTEPYEKQRAFAIAARSYAAFYMQPQNRKFPGKPFDGADDPAIFQAYAGADYEGQNPSWVRAVQTTGGQVLQYKGSVLKAPYFSSNDGTTRSPAEAGWKNFPNAEVFAPKSDPWCRGLTLRGHGVGMSGCGALGQAKEGKSAEQILQYYYPGVRIGER